MHTAYSADDIARLHQARAVRHSSCALPVDRPAQDPDKRVTPQPEKEFKAELRAARVISCREQREREARNGWTQTTHETRDYQPAEYLVVLGATSQCDQTEHRLQQRPNKRRIVEATPANGPLAELLAQFEPRDHWSPRLVYQIVVRTGEALAGRMPSQIAGRHVPKRIGIDTLAMVVCTTATGKPGRGQQTLLSMSRLLLDPKRTEAAMAQFRKRFAPKPKPKPAPYALPTPELITQSRQRIHMQLAS